MLSRRRFLVSGLLGLVSVIAAACAAAIRSSLPSASSLLPTPTSPPPTPASASPSPVGPTLRERIGQMAVVGFRGLTPDEAEPVRSLIADGTLGGVILFSVDQLTGGPRNVESPDQLRSLVAALSGAATAAPLLVAIDQEGGQVARLVCPMASLRLDRRPTWVAAIHRRPLPRQRRSPPRSPTSA